MENFAMNLYFGVDVKENKNFDVRDIVARLFLCPNISPEQAVKMLNMLEKGTLSLNRILKITDDGIQELHTMKNAGEDVSARMRQKLWLWDDKFGLPSMDDYDYVKSKFGFTKSDLVFKKSDDVIQSPQEMSNHVKQFIKGQDEVVDKLAVPFYLHLDSKRNQYTSKLKTPVLVIGPTGVGKSEMFRRYGKICDCPIIRINTSEIVPSAWKGLHITDILAREINEDVTIKDLEYAIIVIHEFDKITHYGQKIYGEHGSDMDSDMMRDIMRLFETEHSLRLEKGVDMQTMCPNEYKLPVDNLLIVFDGAFVGLEEIIKKRLNVDKTIGFNKTQSKKYDGVNIQKFVTNEDLVQWGYMPELLGRIGEVAVMNPLSTDTIYEIMTTAKDNILQPHIEFCSNNNIDLKFEEEAIRYIASEAYKSGLGFRNVKTLLSKTLNSLYFDMPKCKELGKKQVVITREFVTKNLSKQL